jgi:peptidoglycan-associated lipoprotein
MKLTNFANLTVLGLVLTMTAVGCKTKPYQPKVITGPEEKPIDTGIGRGAPIPRNDGGGSRPFDTGGGGIAPNTPGHVGWPENPDALKAQTVYFDFDKSAIRTKEQSKLEEVANYLKSNARAAVRVEGNCDERGTEEYNRSLGERRALAAREYLVNLGIDPARVDTVTNGEDKPAVQGHDEGAWSKNRRDEFIVLTPPR